MTVPLLYLKTSHPHVRGRAEPLSQRRQDVSGRAQENKGRFADRTPGTCQGRPDKSLTERYAPSHQLRLNFRVAREN